MSTLRDNASKEQSASNDVEAARNNRDTKASSWTIYTADESTLPPGDEPDLPPVDGGIKAWSVIGGAFLALFVQFGLGEFNGSSKPFSVPPDSPANTAHI